MDGKSHVLLRRDLRTPVQPPRWPAGISPVGFDPARHAAPIHSLLAGAYARGGGTVSPFGSWWPDLRGDAEYDPSLVFLAAASDGVIVGVAQCWTAGFVKDLAVVEPWRRRGIGRALLAHAFKVLRRREVEDVDLKVEADNAAAFRLYDRLGMRPVAS